MRQGEVFADEGCHVGFWKMATAGIHSSKTSSSGTSLKLVALFKYRQHRESHTLITVEALEK